MMSLCRWLDLCIRGYLEFIRCCI